MSGEIKILVRSSDSRFEDRLVNCQTCWFVIDLKWHLSKILNTKISHESELFHSGKLLTNDMLIGDIFEQQSPDDAQLVYLKMPSSQPSSPLPENEEFLGKLRRRYLLDSTSEALSPETMGPESNSNQPSLHYLSNNVSYAFMAADSNGNSMAQQMLDNTMGPYLSPLPFGHALNQFIWTYQVYAEYMNQYFQYLENVPQTSTVRTEQNEAENVPFPQNNIRQMGQQPPAQVMNAQGGAFLLDDDEDDRNRDWLDWAYVIMRFIMLMCILYFYSTPVRFITFIIASVIFFIYQAGWLAVPHFRRQNENMQQQDVGDGENRNVNEVQRMIPQFVSTLWSIVVCFFVSLAPQVPPPINAN